MKPISKSTTILFADVLNVLNKICFKTFLVACSVVETLSLIDFSSWATRIVIIQSLILCLSASVTNIIVKQLDKITQYYWNKQIHTEKKDT